MSRTMFRTPFFNLLVLLLSICNVAVAQADDALAPRQSPSAAALASPLCQNYATVANISTVALNSTLRAAYIRSAPVGTFTSIKILDAEKPKIMALMMDAQLNQQCGNLSQVALAGADANLTAGTVLGLPILDAPGIGVGDPAMPIVSIAIFLIMGGTWLSL
ncbi:hypothetical protein F4821DRAFT_241256 [Hypoxylon rubiginosum]|uniref:Uncharacterized protein n=1 Tax=Hypoxylon rubiginosum TaxID=110542 RepID=A0ACC0CXX2_9PEZI|nr:hypothetical protein F4821DRAFT_241256 [Hypoxylon rubiginosum]